MQVNAFCSSFKKFGTYVYLQVKQITNAKNQEQQQKIQLQSEIINFKSEVASLKTSESQSNKVPVSLVYERVK